mgnify:CR=1 FL=1
MVVPNPVKLLVKMLLEIVEVESSEPTVSCDEVAIMFPAELVVRIEFGANVVAVNTCEARVEVETVPTSPLDPTNT